MFCGILSRIKKTFQTPRKKTAKRDQIRNKIAIFAAVLKIKFMTQLTSQGEAFDDMPKLTNREREKQVERFNEFYDNFDDFFNDLCEYYNGFRAFYEEHKEISEYLAKADAEEDESKDAEEDAEALALMEAAAAKRDAEVDSAIAAAKAKAKDALKGIAEESIRDREEELRNSPLNDKKSFEAADIDDLPPMQDEFFTFEELKALDGGRTARTFGEWHALNLGVGEALKILEDGKALLTIEEWAMLDRGIDIPQIACSHEKNIDEALKALEDRESLSEEDWNRLGRALRVLLKHCKNLAGKGTTTTTKEG